MVSLTPEGYPAHEESRPGEAQLLSQSAAGVFAGFGLIAALGMGWMLARSTAGMPPFQLRGPGGTSIAVPSAPREVPTLNITAADLAFSTKQLSVASPGEVKVHFENNAVIEHDFSVDGQKSKAYAGPRKAADATFNFSKPGTYTFFCSIPGHKEAGMQGTIVVGDGSGAAATSTTSTAGAASASSQSGSMAGMAGMDHISHATVVSTEKKGNQELKPEIVNGVKVFNLTARAIQWEVAPGVFEEAWAYNDQVPGPLLRVTEGDKVRIHFTNNLPEESVIHVHGPHLPNAMDGVPDVTQPTVKPGQTFDYEFEATPSGTYMYHTHHNSAVQEPLGLYGVFIVDPKPGTALAQRDSQYAVDALQVISEYQGYYVINGHSFPMTEPIKAKVGEKVRIRLVNIGQMAHPMHMHGTSFKIIGTDGHPVEGAPLEKDVVNIAPGERYDIEFTADNPGTWVFHCHILSHVANKGVEPGGMITVIQVDPA